MFIWESLKNSTFATTPNTKLLNLEGKLHYEEGETLFARTYPLALRGGACLKGVAGTWPPPRRGHQMLSDSCWRCNPPRAAGAGETSGGKGACSGGSQLGEREHTGCYIQVGEIISLATPDGACSDCDQQVLISIVTSVWRQKIREHEGNNEMPPRVAAKLHPVPTMCQVLGL